MVESFDVTVVGAGPAGATSALMLSRMGYKVALLDRMHFPRHKACAEYLSPGVVEEIRRLDLEPAFNDLDPYPVAGMRIISPRGGHFNVRYSTQDVPASAFTLSRLNLDSMLVDKARSAGAHLFEGFFVRDFLWKSGQIAGVIGTLNSTPESFHSRLTILADGSRSSLAGKLGLTRKVRWPVRIGLVTHYKSSRRWSGELGLMHVAQDGYCGLAPMAGGHINVAAVVAVDRFRSVRMSASTFLETWIKEHPVLASSLYGCERVTPVRGYSPVGSRVSQAWGPGVLLVGDAAGFFDPFTGEGVYRALRSAFLASTLASESLCRGDASEKQLAAYGVLRNREFRSKHLVSALVQLFVHFPGLLEYALPRLSTRCLPAQKLSNVLGDIEQPSGFLAPRVLWSALRP